MDTSSTQQTPIEDDNYSSNDSPTYGEQEQELIKFQLDVKPVLDNFEHRVLRGEYEYIDSKSGEKRWKKYDEKSKPIINEIGIREILGRLSGYMNIVTKLSYFEDEEIYKNLFYFDLSLAETFAKRSTTWELNIECAKSIKDCCVEMVQSILFSARKGFSAVSLRTQYTKQDLTRTDTSSQNQKRSFLGIPLK